MPCIHLVIKLFNSSTVILGWNSSCVVKPFNMCTPSYFYNWRVLPCWWCRMVNIPPLMCMEWMANAAPSLSPLAGTGFIKLFCLQSHQCMSSPKATTKTAEVKWISNSQTISTAFLGLAINIMEGYSLRTTYIAAGACLVKNYNKWYCHYNYHDSWQTTIAEPYQ